MATSLKIDDILKDRVKSLAALRDRSPHWIMREAIRQYVEREEAAEGFIREAQASWNSFRETGRHLDGGEVDRWLQGWGAERASGPPECHD